MSAETQAKPVTELGRARPRKEDARLVTGKTNWTDNIVLPGIEGSVLRLKPRLIRYVAAYARTEWSPTAAAFIGVLASEQRRRPSRAVTIKL